MLDFLHCFTLTVFYTTESNHIYIYILDGHYFTWHKINLHDVTLTQSVSLQLFTHTTLVYM